MRRILLALLLLATPAAARQADSAACRLCIQASAFLGAGFAGVRIDQLVERPVWIQAPDGTLVRDPAGSLYSSTVNFEWRPALSTGVLIGLWPGGGVGVGLGGHVAFVPADDGVTRPYPAATLHLGRPDLQIYGGWIWTPADEIRLPGDRETAYLPPGLTRDQFLVRGGARTGTLFFGIVAGQTRIAGGR